MAGGYRSVIVLILVSCGMGVFAADAHSAAKTAPGDGESIALGCALYKHHCACCHGTQGKGNGSAAYALPKRPKDLTNPEFWDDDDEDLLEVITKGRGAMPKYEKMLTEPQRLLVISYLRTLAPKPEPKTSAK